MSRMSCFHCQSLARDTRRICPACVAPLAPELVTNCMSPIERLALPKVSIVNFPGQPAAVACSSTSSSSQFVGIDPQGERQPSLS